jgi:excinuclease ABC subunit C
MKDTNGRLLYVGKAKNLRNRIRSYFGALTDPKTSVLMNRVASIDRIVTRNEYEALLLENNLIKKWKPKYNINLKDGKTYPVIRITAEEYPRVFRTRRVVQDGSEYFGPYPSVETIERYLELTERLFPLRKCRGRLRSREHPCLYYHIGRCKAPCAGKCTKEEYLENVEGIRKLLSGETEEVLDELERKMRVEVEALRFEKAAEYRDTIEAIRALGQEQQVVTFDSDVRDYVGYATRGELASFVVFQMRGGKLSGTDVFHAKAYGSDDENFIQFLTQYYDSFRHPPAHIIVPPVLGEVEEQLNTLRTFFREDRGTEVEITIPASGREQSIHRLATENAKQDLERQFRDHGNISALEELEKLLELPKTPMRIEGFDIAQVGGKHPVASMVSFYKGAPDKAEYRRFHIKTLDGAVDDYEAIREAVARRYSRVVNDDLAVPDLILIDGGAGQVNAAREILTALDLGDTPVLGLAKKNEEVFLPYRREPVRLPDGSPPLKVLQHVRDEAHRFATNFRARLQSKEISKSGLENIKGIGPKRSRKLMESFGSTKAIRAADVERIAEVAGISEELAVEVKNNA